MRSNAIALTALFLVLGSGAWALTPIGPNTVGSQAIKTGAVGSPEVAKGAIGTSELKEKVVDSGVLALQAVAAKKVQDAAWPSS